MKPALDRAAVWPLLAAITLLAGCAPFQDDRPPPREYVLETPTENPGVLQPRHWPQPLVLTRPQVPPGLDGTRIRIRRPGQQLDHIADVRWAAPLPDLLQDALRGALAEQFDDAAARADEISTPHRLEVRVEEFHPIYASSDADNVAPAVRVALVLQLVEQSSGDTVATATASSQADVTENRVTAIVAALDRALAGAFAEALERMEDQLAER